MTATAIALRDWQEATIAKVTTAQERGVRRALVVAATGLGKTVLFTAFAQRHASRTLILAHRDELIEQAARKVEDMMPGARVGRVKGALNETRADVVVASVQTLARTSRLQQLPSASWDPDAGSTLFRTFGTPFDLVIVDEAHHAAAPSYRRILEHLGAGHEDGPFLLGVTATPDRGDGAGLDGVFDEVVASYDMLWGIRSGYLSDLRGLAVTVDGFNAGDLKVSKGDYDQGQAGRLLAEAGASGVVVKAWLEHARGRRTLVFTPTVAFAEDVARSFAVAGVRAGTVSGAMPLDERRAVLAAFSRGDLDVLANCAVLTEGYDEPRVDCVVVARPTKSRALYVQMVGRGTRLHPDKDDCLVVDLVGASSDHQLITVPSLFGLGKVKDACNASRGLAELSIEHEAEQVRLGAIRAEDVDLFRSLRARSSVAWVPVHSEGAPLRRYHVRLPAPLPTVVLAQRVAGEDVWTAGLLHPDGRKEGLLIDHPMAEAQAVAEDYARRHGGAIAAVDAPWRSRKPTRRMLEAAKRWRVTVDPSWTAGQVSDAIDRRAGRAGGRHRTVERS